VTIYNRHDKFEDGESLDDLAARMDQAIDEIVWPHVIEAINTGHTDSHIVVVSHGLAISEAVAARGYLTICMYLLSNACFAYQYSFTTKPCTVKHDTIL
jgi:broad specificity phosphatase PhoE